MRLPASEPWVKNQDRRLLRVNTKIPSELATPFCLSPVEKPNQTSSSFLSFRLLLFVPTLVCVLDFKVLAYARPQTSPTTETLQSSLE